MSHSSESHGSHDLNFMTPPINSVSDEVLAELLAYEGDLYLSHAAQPHLRRLLTELLSRRAANSAGGVEGLQRYFDDPSKWPGEKPALPSQTVGDELFAMLQSAYLRGAAWTQDNGFNEGYLSKAAYDYADKTTSSLAVEAEPVAWVTADILAAMKRGERAVPGWKRSDDFCIPLYTHPSSPVSAEVTEEALIAVARLYGNYIDGHGWTGFGPRPEDILAALNGGREK